MNGITSIKSVSIAALVAGFLLTGTSAALAQARQSAEDTLARRSQEATTAREHAGIAREYRLRAEALDKQAKAYEAEAARKSARPRFPVEGKMVAHIRNTGERERQLAVQTRRAAEQALERADHHVRLAVEGQLAE